jgi:hypothetical protein
MPLPVGAYRPDMCACIVLSVGMNLTLALPPPRPFLFRSLSNELRFGTKLVSHMCRPGRTGKIVPAPK